MNSGGLRGCPLSTYTNAGAGDKTPNYVCNPPLFIAFVTNWPLLFLSFYLSICCNVSVCRALGQAYSLASFGLCVGFLSDLPMCMTARVGH